LNFLRLIFALLFISIYTYFTRGLYFATDANIDAWLWLSLSGIVGFVIGALLLFRAYVVIGARLSMLIMSLAPPITAFLGWLILDEALSIKQFIAMLVTITGIAVVLWKKPEKKEVGKTRTKLFKHKPSVVFWGLLLAFGGACGQAGGLVLSKKGMGDYDAFAATQIRIIAGIVGFSIILTFSKLWKKTINGFKNVSAIKWITLGSFAGPFLGVSFSLIAVKYTETGIAATLSSLAPIIIILPAMFIFKEKIKPMEIIGSIITVIGVGLFFLY
ncbi:MAG: DMT family transporter, partial [Bacteroidales bacterium]|nr:DMT family transporter [Bacteroidales bacterium]